MVGAFTLYLSAFGAYHWYCGRLMLRGAFPSGEIDNAANTAFDPLFQYADSDLPGPDALADWGDWCVWQGLGAPNLKLEQPERSSE